MTLLAIYPSKKELKASVGQKLKYRETSFFGEEYKPNGTFAVANRPSITGIGREFFAEVTMQDGKIIKVT